MEEHLDYSDEPQPSDNGLLQPVVNDLGSKLVPAHHADTFDKPAKGIAPAQPETQPSGSEPSPSQDAGAETAEEAAQAAPEPAEQPPVEQVEVQPLDLTDEVQNQPGGLAAVAEEGVEPHPSTERWNPEQALARDRRWVALLLLWVLVGTILCGLGLISTKKWTGLTSDEVGTFFTVVFTSVVALVGSVTGFYFGTKVGPRDS